MKTWYLTKNFLATIYLSLNSLTVITFDEPIDSYFLGVSQKQIFSVLSKDKKSLVLKGLTKGPSNLLVKTKTDQFGFLLSFSKKDSGNIEVKRAKRNHTYKLLKKVKDYTIYEGASSRLKVFPNGLEEVVSKF